MWFKRDLRLSDHTPLNRAAESNLPLLLLYTFEPSLIDDPHYDDRHWRFVWESLQEMQHTLGDLGHQILIVHEEAEAVFTKLNQLFEIKTLFSHEETGIDLTYKRDIRIAELLTEWGITWDESPTNAVQRGLMHRNGWRKKWASILSPGFTIHNSRCKPVLWV